ncbi:PREDICTED: immune-associated nucleotide-binding protein 8-like [Nelumbo nucifera]|uniref:AIG1-type G domain-containing protein n=2 Tax=Nelumbo nucifera TaxID=4432 RepID=A0A822YCN7_NELNU|nr:PREDICTED: immune-associated nucleotide-binding protein 8-like [Nelumbo nucifera]DAD29049.1 TPA_asm: hypothetical protein HUJ06_030517 [Nelumbo nucifera]DAD30291.1 TPA_asm: hypothetical protein HUJ06_031759 [Nelumbo nucifera]
MASSNDVTMVLLGRTGNGKSSTANSILKTNAFKAKRSSNSVTRTTELQSSILQDGRTVNVIDTPGLFDFALDVEYIKKEIVKCIDLAKNGIHAMLMVFSTSTRFSKEEEAGMEIIKGIFGQAITDHIIIVFTGGDSFDEDDDEALQDYLAECPKPFQEILQQCKHRIVLFDNKTKDQNKRDLQVCKLISLVNKVVSDNGGQPYTNELHTKLQREMQWQRMQLEEAKSKGLNEREILMMQEKMQKAYDEQLKQVTQMVESRFTTTISYLQEQRERERIALSNALQEARMDREKSAVEMTRIVQELCDLKRQNEEFQRKLRPGRVGGGGCEKCPIL